MASSEWEEVKRLAKDFQRAQLTTATQKLSERNCIEIVNKLIEDKKIEVIYTLDGKEYLTPSQVVKEIRDELIIHGGRINLVELQQILNIDFSYIEAKANEVVKNDRNVFLVLGQLIDNDYLDHLAEEINDQLQDAGQVSIAELTKANDVPADFLTEAIEQRMGRIIEGQMDAYDRGVIFTQAFVDRHRARIRGIFSAITKPTQVSNILNQYHIPERLFHSILEGLEKEKRLKGSLMGGRQEKASYIPDIFTKTQNDWVDSFYAQNGYLEFDALSRLGIPDPKSFAKRRFKSENLLILQSCCIGKVLQDRVEASVEEALSSGTWIDVLPLLPSSFTSTDCGQILHHCLKGNRQLDGKVFCDTIICSHKFMADCKAIFYPIMKVKAKEDAKRAPDILMQADKKPSGGSDAKRDRKEERRKKAAGVGGGGSAKGGVGGQAREVKTKKVKKGRGKEVEEDDDEDTQRGSRVSASEFPFMTLEKMEEMLSEKLDECPVELHAELAEELFRPLTRAYQDVVKVAFQMMAGGSAATRRKTRDDLQDGINAFWNNIRQFIKGVKQCSGDEELEGQLSRYLLRSLCSDVTNMLCCAVAEPAIATDPLTLTPEMRSNIISKLPDKIKTVMSKLNSSLSGKDLDEFVENLEQSCDPSVCDIMLKKPDKKKDRQAVFHHRQALCEQLRNETDSALALHLTITVAFQNHTQCMLHAPGRCVPQLITFLSKHLTADQHALLVQYQDLVQKNMAHIREQDQKNSAPSGEEEGDKTSAVDEESKIKTQLQDLLNKIKDVALVKKGSAANHED
ncbi:E3 UFM1-protein ligase 1-like [Lytechinus variegatus]|uniref:E3 UFM1-protein ligase 1-like n=1 Tax=Lytechinus variegatus TaxID=7654 RepID=UPI001BB1E0E9|nr:E3 UFM1-protein ligase 1-like [Lytechinus variegatus]